MKQLPKALRAVLVALALISLPARAEKSAEQGMLPDPVELLKPYYSALRPQISLPQAGPNPALPAQTTVHRLAFGSCEHQSYPQAFWNAIGDADPQLFLMLGDNVYGDLLWNGGADLGSLRTAYAKLAGHTEFAAFRSVVPMMETWDDHDFGFNDGGSAFAFREWSETIFEHFWNAGEAVRSRPGVYDSAIFGEEGKRLQVILLDTRFFRSPFQLLPADAQPTVHGPYRPDDTPGLEMLGEAQWAWLQQELAKPADLRIIASSIQVMTDAHGYESWRLLPLERDRLYRMIGARAGGGVLLLSGDRHRGAIYSASPAALGEELWEFTSSSLNLPVGSGDRSADEADPSRRTGLYADPNFGLVDIDWAKKRLTLSLMDDKGGVIARQEAGWTGK